MTGMLFTVPVRLESTANKREHWGARARRAKAHRHATYYAIAAAAKPAKSPLPCVVTIMRVAPRPLDTDNLAISAKAIRDQIAYHLGVNDNDPRVEWRYKQCKGEPKVYEVFVTIEPCLADEPMEGI